jgi:GxxExxY protein
MNRELPDHLRGLPEWDRCRAVIGAFFETYNHLDHGYLESVYREALAIELRARGMRAQCEAPVEVFYKGIRVGTYRVDILVDDRVVVELKSGPPLGPTDRRQLLNYLRTTQLDVGLLLHYGPEPKFYRLVSPRVVAASNARRPRRSEQLPARDSS